MKEQFTPGPWISKIEIDGKYIQTVVVDKYDEVICKIRGKSPSAHLIAAAPDMYEACERALDYLKLKYPPESEILHQLKAALSKANPQ